MEKWKNGRLAEWSDDWRMRGKGQPSPLRKGRGRSLLPHGGLWDELEIEPSGPLWHKQDMAEAQSDTDSRTPPSVDAEALVEVHGERLLRSAYLLCGDATEAQDLVQETLLQAIKSAHRFRGDSAVYTWL